MKMPLPHSRRARKGPKKDTNLARLADGLFNQRGNLEKRLVLAPEAF